MIPFILLLFLALVCASLGCWVALGWHLQREPERPLTWEEIDSLYTDYGGEG